MAWVDGLPNVTRSHLDGWELRCDGEPTHGSSSIVLPVRTADGAPAVFKITCPEAESEHEHLALRRWGGDGAVRMLSADPHSRAIPLERLTSPRFRAARPSRAGWWSRRLPSAATWWPTSPARAA
jgi:streptomycin 6-kinase